MDRLLVLVCAAVLLLVGCSWTVPSDPDGTLDRVETEGVLHAGAAPRPGWVAWDGSGDPAGPEVRLVEEFAAAHGARVEWTVSGEEELMTRLERGALDLVVGGLTDTNAWNKEVGLTRPYTEVTVAGDTEKHVMAVPMGENRLQSELETWLDVHGAGR